MTRKDYIAIAEALAKTRPNPVTTPVQWYQWEADRAAIADVLAADNSRFNRQRFYDTTEKE